MAKVQELDAMELKELLSESQHQTSRVWLTGIRNSKRSL
jgi:hypothetical protein